MLIHRLELKNLLSFRDSTIELGPLNVLIGPNAVGKSNLIEAIGHVAIDLRDIGQWHRAGSAIAKRHRTGRADKEYIQCQRCEEQPAHIAGAIKLRQ